MKTNEQMAADLKARGSALAAAKRRRGRVLAGVGSCAAVAALAVVVLSSGLFGPTVPAVSGDASKQADRTASTGVTTNDDAIKDRNAVSATDADGIPETFPAGTEEEDVCSPIIFASTDVVKGAARGEATRGKATLSPALLALIEKTRAEWNADAKSAFDERTYYVVTVDFSACFDEKAASGFLYLGKTVAEYEAELQQFAAALPRDDVAVTAASGQATTEAVVGGELTDAQRQSLTAKKEALTAAKAAYARGWMEKIGQRLRAVGWEGTFAGADSREPDDAALAAGQARAILTLAQMKAVVCGEEEGILFLPASKIAGNAPASDAD